VIHRSPSAPRSDRSRRVKRLFTIAFLLAVAGCASTARPTLPDGYLIAVVHSSGGPAPYMAWLGVYSNRQAVFRSADRRLSRTEIERARHQRIQALLARAELQAELESLTSRSEPYSDFEEVFFLFGGKEYRFVCGEVEPQGAVLDLLREIRAVEAFRLGNRPFVGPPCMSEP